MSGLEIAAIAGLGFSLFSEIKAAEARSDAADLNAKLKDEQAKELLERSKINIARIEQSGRDVVGRQEVAVAASGFELTGSTLLLLEDTYRRVAEAVSDVSREASFRADQLRKGAEIQSELASDAFTASLIGAGGRALLGGVNLAGARGGAKGATQPLIPQLGSSRSFSDINSVGPSPVFGFEF